MWFAFPKEAASITVEHQTFVPEAKDSLGRSCFRAPAHFSPRILAIPGFAMAGDMIDAPPDLAPGVSGDQQAIADLTSLAEANAAEIKGLREDLIKSDAKLVAMTNERDALLKEVEELKLDIEDYKTELQDYKEGKGPDVVEVVGTDKQKKS